jgi:hypothetical protein
MRRRIQSARSCVAGTSPRARNIERRQPSGPVQRSQTASRNTRVSAESSSGGQCQSAVRQLDPIQPARQRPKATAPTPPVASTCIHQGVAASSRTAQPAATSANHAASLSARRVRTSSARVGEFRDDMGPVRIGRNLPPHHVREQLGIREVQQRCERLLFGGRRGRITFPEISFEQNVELAHPPTAPPAEHGGSAQCRRSAIFFLISAIALAGFRSFGQASVQFMIVWQRYRRNGSSSSSRRSPVASSRVSTIQR